MNLNLSGKGVEVSEAFRAHVEQSLKELFDRHQMDPVESAVVIHKQRFQFVCDITSHLSKRIVLRSQGYGTDGYTSFDDSLVTLTNRLRRHKKRLQDHQKHHDVHVPLEVAPTYVLESFAETNGTEEKEGAPAVIAETQTEIPSLSVADAVMRLDLSNENAFVFRNTKGGDLSFLYRRPDGNIGWIDLNTLKS